MPSVRAHCRPLEPREEATHLDAARGVAVIDRSRSSRVLIDPTRRRILELLNRAASATTLARQIGLSRQLVNYHVRALERAGLVEEVERRQRRGLQERIVRATASHFLIAPEAVGLGATAAEAADRFSATYQIAVAARTIREVAALAELARDAGRRLTTLSLDTEIHFSSPAAREAFANELVESFNALIAKHHAPAAGGGRSYRVFVGAHPVYRPDTGTRKGRKKPVKPKASRARARRT